MSKKNSFTVSSDEWKATAEKANRKESLKKLWIFCSSFLLGFVIGIR